jgi:MFS family permease
MKQADQGLNKQNSAISVNQAITLFLAFAFAYLLSTLVRAITATLSPMLTLEFSLQASDLGLLGGGYFLGFAATQLPMGRWLDQHGPKHVLVAFLSVAVAGCLAFSMAQNFEHLLIARIMIGVGVSACLMAPLTGFRKWLQPSTQLRANSWMLMTGSLGMLLSTLPVQWLLPLIGWRPIFMLIALSLVIAVVALLICVPTWKPSKTISSQDSDVFSNMQAQSTGLLASYKEVWAHSYFKRLIPIGFFSYGGMVAMQTLWAGPWMNKVSGNSPLESAQGLFAINVTMLITYWAWGMSTPLLRRWRLTANQIISWGLPLNILAMIWLTTQGAGTGWLVWALFFITNSVVSLAQPALGLAFPPNLAGRALSAFNLLIFAGVFVVQWGFGLLIDLSISMGATVPMAYQLAMAVFAVTCTFSYVYFLMFRPHNRTGQAETI